MTTSSRPEVRVTLHPADYTRAVAAADCLKMPADEFYALAIHVGTVALLQQRGMVSHTPAHQQDLPE